MTAMVEKKEKRYHSFNLHLKKQREKDIIWHKKEGTYSGKSYYNTHTGYQM